MIGESGGSRWDTSLSHCVWLPPFFILAELIGQMVVKRKGQQVKLGILGDCLKRDHAGVCGRDGGAALQ